MNRSLLSDIEAIAAAGKAVMVGDAKTIEAIVKDAIENDRTVSFYLTNAQAEAVREWYWKPSWVAHTGLREISAEEAAKIGSKLGLNNHRASGSPRSSVGADIPMGRSSFWSRESASTGWSQ
jgi:hypothetical protein